MNLPPLPTPYYPQWSHSNEFAAFTSDQVRQAQRDAVSELAIASDARIAGLQDQINRDSVELRSLCQARDDARKERDAAKAMASELEKDRDYCEKQWHEALATHENIEALKSRIAELEAALRQIGDMAHDASTGPAVPDTLWDIRCEAYELLKD